MDVTLPFRGYTALTSGLLTPGVLRGPRFRRLFPDVYVGVGVEVDLALRARAAYLLVEGRGVVGGYAAAELLDASCGPEDAPVDVVHRGRLRADEIVVPYVLDLAYPAIRLAIEYDGEAHRVQQRAMRDLDRQAYLSDAGWKVLRFTAAQIMRRPRWVAARVREEIVKAARRHGVALDTLGLR